jgi:hypothetical protein
MLLKGNGATKQSPLDLLPGDSGAAYLMSELVLVPA